MDKDLTPEQKQSIKILENYFNDIAIFCNWINQLNITMESDFFCYNFQDLPKELKNANLSKVTKEYLSDIITNYNTYQLYAELSAYISEQLKNFVDNLVDNAYK